MFLGRALLWVGSCEGLQGFRRLGLLEILYGALRAMYSLRDFGFLKSISPKLRH